LFVCFFLFFSFSCLFVLSLGFLNFYFYSCYLFSFYTINFTVTIFPSLLLPLHSPSRSCAKIHCSPSQQFVLPHLTHSLPLPSPSPSILSQPVTRLPLTPTHSSPTDQPTIPTLHKPKPLTQASSNTTEIHPNTHKDYKNQQQPHCFPHSHIPLTSSPFSATLSNSPNFYTSPNKH
jgi:hypothetical protein